MVKLCAVTALAVALIVLGQESGGRYDALKQALGLSDAQVSQLQQTPPKAIVRPAPTGSAVAIYQAGRFSGMPRQLTPSEDSLRVLDDAQRAKLAVIQKVLDRLGAATLAIEFGLISEQQWPGSAQCPVRYDAYAAEFGLSESQMRQLERLTQAAREPLWAQLRAYDMQRSEVLNSGVSADSPTVVQLGSEENNLQAQIGKTRPPHDLALAVLDEAQKAKLAAFETGLQLAREAIELGLIPKPVMGEILCH